MLRQAQHNSFGIFRQSAKARSLEQERDSFLSASQPAAGSIPGFKCLSEYNLGQRDLARSGKLFHGPPAPREVRLCSRDSTLF